VIAPESVPDAVVEGFGCRLPDVYVSAMVARSQSPVWINMEYLSAESWVDDCHRMASPQPSVPLTKYFFFPGFTAKTGGLFREADVLERRRQFQQDTARRRVFLASLGVVEQADCLFSLFCYEHAPIAGLFEALARQEAKRVLCLVPEGVASASVSAFLRQPASVGAVRTEGALTVRVIPFMDQDDYDQLLWSCDLNFVRGEDSFLRAQWAARPFVWQAYPQDEAAHIPKINAFLERYLAGLPPDSAECVARAWQVWNAVGSREEGAAAQAWSAFFGRLHALTRHGPAWADALGQMEDFASSLVWFIDRMR
jgi:uncharacterized repeat protein (TIGR03837 family)